MSESFIRKVAIPSNPNFMTANSLAVTFENLGIQLHQIGDKRVLGLKINASERMVEVTLEGVDPYPKQKREIKAKETKPKKKG